MKRVYAENELEVFTIRLRESKRLLTNVVDDFTLNGDTKYVLDHLLECESDLKRCLMLIHNPNYGKENKTEESYILACLVSQTYKQWRKMNIVTKDYEKDLVRMVKKYGDLIKLTSKPIEKIRYGDCLAKCMKHKLYTEAMEVEIERVNREDLNDFKDLVIEFNKHSTFVLEYLEDMGGFKVEELGMDWDS